ncbi:sensor histidine kinase [Kibdelosporangium aridum]|uniref:histidine kinase n=1 Tax=Kibdelosporangium aridum TaxID=2030 RepID=A0A1W2FE22_KIBAR|nr:histidine kinase [Kibdelosporangium aridum]SMD20309.1 Signal transduction histidine kinase [Kibdelosporangium aridum]
MSVAVFLAVTAGAVVALKFGLTAWASAVVLLVALFLGISVGRRTVVVTVVVALAGFAVAVSFVVESWWAGIGPMIPAALVTGAAVGDAIRSRRELASARAERIRRDERLRIAQDVHDMVAQHVAVVNVQAGAAAHLLKSNPDKAAEALEHVTTTSAKVLDELGSLLGVLRDPVLDLESLLDDRVEVTVIGERRPLPATVDVTVYRVVQESLANARKYGTGWVQLSMEYQPDQLVIEVRNERSGTNARGTGHGLIGMRERVALVDGKLSAGPEGKHFVVRAVL